MATMASALEDVEGCDECGDLDYLIYNVGIVKRLCSSCYGQQDNIISKENDDEQWMCSYHDNVRVGLFCLSCKCGICLQCVDDNMHAGHESISIHVAEEHVRRNMKEALDSIDDEQKKVDALKDHLDNCEKMKNHFFNTFLRDVRQKGVVKYRAIEDMLAGEKDAVDQEFNKQLQELYRNRDAQMKAAEEKALERKRSVDEFCESLTSELKEQRKSLDKAGDCGVMAKTLHDRKNILEKSRILIESFRESKGKHLLLGGEDTLGSWEKNESNLRIDDITSRTAKACEDMKYLLPKIRDNYKDRFSTQKKGSRQANRVIYFRYFFLSTFSFVALLSGQDNTFCSCWEFIIFR